MANTTNLNLVKPAGTDFALVSVINGNMDIIDSKVGAIPANESAQSQITALNNQLTNLIKSKTETITTTQYGWLSFPAGEFILQAQISYKILVLNKSSTSPYNFAAKDYIENGAVGSLANNTAYSVTYYYI